MALARLPVSVDLRRKGARNKHHGPCRELGRQLHKRARSSPQACASREKCSNVDEPAAVFYFVHAARIVADEILHRFKQFVNNLRAGPDHGSDYNPEGKRRSGEERTDDGAQPYDQVLKLWESLVRPGS